MRPSPSRLRGAAPALRRGAFLSVALAAVLAAGIGAAVVASWPFGMAAARAQGLGLQQGSDQPVEINADEGIEWRQEQKIYVAKGNASAKRGDVTLHADTLTAHYRPTGEGGTDIWRIDAAGHVSIVSPSATASGDNGVYEVPTGILVLKGRDLKLVAQSFTVTARDSLEYYEAKRMAVARGNADVTSEDRNLKADIVTAYFRDASEKAPKKLEEKSEAKSDAKSDATPRTKPAGTTKAKKPAGAGDPGATELQRVEAFDNVRVSSPGQVATAERGVYDVESGIVTLYGSVKITRGDNQLNGEFGEMNMNTGVSRLLSGPPGAEGRKPVRGLFSPKKKPEIAPREAPAQKPPAQ
ncbi:MAG: LptA/OstA family protein [Alphaproteobacteria bacterium]